MPVEAKPLKIAELERLSGVPRSTVHHYLNLGLLPRPRVVGPKKHFFGSEHLERLREIQTLRSRGWGLARIREHVGRVASRKRTRRAAQDAPEGVRRRIIEEATRLFAEGGYHGVRLTDVARELGMGKATLYRYFDSKQALFVACVEQVRFALVPREAREASERYASFAEQGRHRAAAVLSHFQTYRTLHHLLAGLAHGPDPELAERARTELHAMITNAEPLLRKLMAKGLVRNADSELLAYMLWGALMGAGERLILDSRYTLDQVLDAYLAFSAAAMASRKA